MSKRKSRALARAVADPPAERPGAGVRAPRPGGVVAEFQSDAVVIEESTPPRVARLTLYLVVALIAAAVAWASLSTIDKIVTAQGKLITTRPNLVVQPLETSVIREIHVAVGDVLRQGQALATLDPTFSQADVDSLRARVDALRAAAARLDAELGGRVFVLKTPDDAESALQARLFAQRKAFYDASVRNYDAQVASIEADQQTNRDAEGLTVQRLETVRSIETMRSQLMDKEVGSRLNYLQARDTRLEVEDNLSRLRGSKVDLAHKLEKARAERQAFIEDFLRTASQELVDTRGKLNAAAEELKKAELRQHMIVLTAPVDSVVLEIAHRSVGSVVREAETLFVLVPRDVPLEAEVNVESRDIAEIALGQQVRLKFDAFPFQKYGTASGVVRVISQDSFAPEVKSENEGGPPGEGTRNPTRPFYRVRIEATDLRLRGFADQFAMIPGMTLTAEMKVGRRRVISYFLYPLLRGLDESIREP
jgi:HlyD family secretion protein